MLSTQILPPIFSTSRLEIARPRPVPPYLRVVELSSLHEWFKDLRLRFRRNADAGVLDFELQGNFWMAFQFGRSRGARLRLEP